MEGVHGVDDLGVNVVSLSGVEVLCPSKSTGNMLVKPAKFPPDACGIAPWSAQGRASKGSHESVKCLTHCELWLPVVGRGLACWRPHQGLVMSHPPPAQQMTPSTT